MIWLELLKKGMVNYVKNNNRRRKILDNKQLVPKLFRRPQHWIIQQFRLNAGALWSWRGGAEYLVILIFVLILACFIGVIKVPFFAGKVLLGLCGILFPFCLTTFMPLWEATIGSDIFLPKVKIQLDDSIVDTTREDKKRLLELFFEGRNRLRWTDQKDKISGLFYDGVNLILVRNDGYLEEGNSIAFSYTMMTELVVGKVYSIADLVLDKAKR